MFKTTLNTLGKRNGKNERSYMVTMRVHIMHDISFTYSLGRYLPIENINKFNMAGYIFLHFF